MFEKIVAITHCPRRQSIHNLVGNHCVTSNILTARQAPFDQMAQALFKP